MFSPFFFISQPPSFQEKKLHVFHWCHLPQDLIAVVAPAVIMDRKLTRAYQYHCLIQTTSIPCLLGLLPNKKLARNKSLKSPGLKKSAKNAKFSIVSVSLYNYDSRYFFISWRLWLKSFPSNLTRKIEPNLYILKLMNVFNKFLKLISIISPAKYSSDILGKCHDE